MSVHAHLRIALLNINSQRRVCKRAVYWRKFERWQERVKAAEEKRKTIEGQRRYIKGTDVYLTPEVESSAPPGKDPGNLTIAERGGMTFETSHYYSRFRYLDLHPRTLKLYEEYQMLITHQYDQRFIPERHLLLGPDLAASHFIVHRGGAVKFVGDDRWHRMNAKGEYFLPGRQIPDLRVEAIDASNTALMFEGLENFGLYISSILSRQLFAKFKISADLEQLRFLSLRGCKFINDFCMSQMRQFEGSLEFLDLSDCKKVSADGLSALSCLKKLKFLRIEGMDQVKNIALAALRLEDAVPQLKVVGLDYDLALDNWEKQLRLLSHKNVVQDAKGNAFLKDDLGELYYVSGNVPVQPSLADDKLPIFVSTIRKDPPALPLETTEEINRMSDGRLKHLLAGSPSGEWTQETERVLQVDARRLCDEGKMVHPFMQPCKPEDTSWKARLEHFARRIELLEENETLSNLVTAPRKTETQPALSPSEPPKANATTRSTCTTCRLTFESSQLQRAHHQSEWHLYNMRRKMACLEPIPREEFERKAAEFRQTPMRLAEEHLCKLCNKRFHSFESYGDHLQSKRHVENAKIRKMKETVQENSNSVFTPPKMDLTKTASVAKEATVVQICLFCSTISRDLERNLEHMSTEHGFFIPDVNYCISLEGLLTYLHDKVATHHLCLWCSDKSKAFQSLAAAQTHMRDKGHCKVFHYDNAIAELTDFYDYRKKQEEDEDTDEQSDTDSDSDDSDLDFAVVDDAGYQLYLPSGAVAGHRSLFRYYRQNLRPLVSTNPSDSGQRIRRIVDRYKRLGWNAPSKAAVVVRAKDQKFIMRCRAKAHLRVGVKANALQRHYRKQVTY
ncbi:zinc finger, C2H2 type [Trichuris suis]|nr:zinc finger, C2H2 type [Trichuris suis]